MNGLVWLAGPWVVLGFVVMVGGTAVKSLVRWGRNRWE